ncbi:uncharacterized protein LOC109853674 isoform X2 [Pseudomyrmex gracilis]|uniref:uncharacterized protein LOC109853674 isoform X2 n=1 Tax=Pseudomyrmex gracilis TaxID=219809 RepID=UPI0009953244|nr:uncharacterized protein LOC109853674 isoform X2 [Pseudomyrmex gracilis]
MISSIVSRLVILVFGTLYPAYASYKAVRTKNVKEYVKWMMYWIVFALFTCAETFTDVFFSFWFPFYYEIKIILVLWLLSPATKGSSILYRRFVHPALIRREAEIDEALARATEQGYTAVLHLGTKGVNYATTVLMQTAIKGGGGLVQQLRKSYSLSDLTGEKEDENRNTPDVRDETDMEVEPRRREHAGRRGYSPRRTQSSSNASRVEMYFSEVDVDVRQSRPREHVASTLTNIRSSDDISSGYSSGEALQSQRTHADSLVRTSSVGAKTRVKPRSTAKKTPEDRDEDFDRIVLPSPENISLPSSLNVLTPEQAAELLLLFSEISKNRPIREFPVKSANENRSVTKISEDRESSSTESSSDFVDTDPPVQADVQTIQTVEIKNISMESVSIPAVLTKNTPDKMNVVDTSMEELNYHRDNEPNTLLKHIDDKSENRSREDSLSSPTPTAIVVDNREQITSEICQEKIDELKQLLDDAHKAITNIVSSQEKLAESAIAIENNNLSVSSEMKIDDDLSDNKSSRDGEIQRSPTPSSSNNLDVDNRAGKYHKKPAPKTPPGNEAINNEDEIESQNALKATLVIKTGTLRTVSNADVTKDIFLAHAPDSTKKKKKSRLRAKDGFSKLLTIPKNIFHNAFHKEQHETSSKEEDSSSTFSETSGSASRSNSIGSQVYADGSAKLSTAKREMNVEEIPLRPEGSTKISDININYSSSVEKLDVTPATSNDVKTDLENKFANKTADDKKNVENSDNCEKNVENKKSGLEMPFHSGRKEIITDI